MSEAKESPCPDCGEMVRINSLRCWNCGAFMNSEVEKKYMEMQSQPKEVVYSELPQAEVSALDNSDEDDGDDFELSMPTAKSDSDEIPADPNEPDKKASIDRPVADAEEGASSEDLLKIAMQEEKQLNKQRRKRAQRGGMKTPGGGLIIFCPYGCRMVVKESHRGMQGKCPECKAPFIVPVDPPDYRKEKTDEGPAEAASQGGFDRWMLSLKLHSVNIEKLKVKANSLVKEFLPTDFGFSDDQLLVIDFGKKLAGKLGGKDDPRGALQKQLQEGKKIEELEVANKYAFSKDDLSQLKVVQPTASRADSIFHGVPVFGEGRVAVQLPPIEGVTEILYVSMGITQFWEFSKALDEKLGISGFGADAGLPSELTYATHRCHYLETPVKALENVELLKADESVKLDPIGYQCGKCQAVVSEEGRAREKLGGKSPKGIAKAKCPKCGNKMGDNPLFAIHEEATEEASK